MSRALHLGLFAISAAAATLLGGWWAIPLLAALWVRVLPRATASTCALGAALGWALLLAWAAVDGPVGTVARRVGGVFLLPGWGFVALTLIFAALLAASAAIAARRARIQ
jgi:hypothetical protein